MTPRRGALDALFFFAVAWLFADVVAALGAALLFDSYRAVLALELGARVVALGAAGAAIVVFARVPGVGRGALAGAATAALVAAAHIALVIVAFAGEPTDRVRELAGLASAAAWALFIICSVIVFAAVGRARDAQVSMGFGIAAIVVYLWWAGMPFAAKSTWGFVLLTTVLRVIWGALWVLVANQVRKALDDEPSRAGQWAPTEEWNAAARGLGLYSAGIKIAVLVIVGALGGVITAVVVRSAPILIAVIVLVPIGMLATQVLMLVGLAGWVRVPADSGARALAVAGLLMQGLALLLALGVIALTLGRSLDGSLREHEVGGQQWLSTGNYVLSLGALLCLLGSFSRAARHIGARELAPRVMPTALLLVIIVVGSLLQRLITLSPAAGGKGEIIVGIAIVLIGIMAILMYVGLVDRLRWAIIDGPRHDDMSDPDFV